MVLLVQDAIPGSDRWLQNLVRPLVEDAGVAGSYARQTPRPEASALTRHYLSGWVATKPEPRLAALAGKEELDSLPPMDRVLRCAFDNVCSCIRREVWEAHPFPQSDIAEDIAWAREVLLAGYRLAYVPDAFVIHSHDRSARYELWRTYLVHRKLRTLFGLRTVPTPFHALRAVASCLVVHLRCLAREGLGIVRRPGEIFRVLALAVAFPLGQYLGALSADRGWNLLRPRGV